MSEPLEIQPPEEGSDPVVTPSEQDLSGILPFPVVGIGGSAGGIEAALELFQHLPEDSGMAFILVTHMSPTHKSHLTEILTARVNLPVHEIQNHVRPEPNHIYVMPPNFILTIQGGYLDLAPIPENRHVMVIDEFFRSLAADQKFRAVGIVLSGMDTDGALGMRAIKGEGGIAIVQAPETARFASMPRSSIGADHIDLVVAPSEIGLELGRLALQYNLPEVQSLEKGQAPDGQEQQFNRILNLLTGVSNVEFRGYKHGTLQRRIARRMLLRRFATVAEYLRELQVNEEELRALHEDVLIGVTRFFRDSEVFGVLKSEILPRIFGGRDRSQPIRIWVAGCSSGEEVYSVAITLLEFLSGESIEPNIQIFGTDASENAIQRARMGIFPESISTDVSPERLRRFFVSIDRGYQVAKRVRDLCIFARQNLSNDPPFGRIDLVSCRNVMIYLGQDLQKRIIPTFHYALNPNGFLILGSSETIFSHQDLFTLVDRKHKIYSKVPTPTPISFELQRTFAVPIPSGNGRQFALSTFWTDAELMRTADRIVLARYGPPGVVVNDKGEILQSRGHTGRFLEMAQGASSLHLLRMLRDNIAGQVQDALRKAIENDIAVHIPALETGIGNDGESIALDVLPLHPTNGRTRCFLLLFPTNSTPAVNRPQPAALKVNHSEKDRYITEINDDLASAKLHLQSLLEERDARNQELVSANEEIQSANEELQSANEELETTKEELQSSNEELQTVNEELQQRNTALTQASNDLSNLLNSVNLPLLMLSDELRIRQFTPLTQRLMNIRPSDIGRPINEIRLNLSIEDLEPILLDVLESLGTREVEVQDRDGRWRLMRVRPYRTSDNKIQGVVMVLVDIDDLRRSQQDLRVARDYACAVIECIKTPIVVVNLDLKIRTVNSAFRSLAGLPNNDLETRSFPELAAMLWGMEDIRPRLSKLATEQPEFGIFEYEHEFMQGTQRRAFVIWARLVRTDGEQVILMTLEDVSAQKQAESIEALSKQELQFQFEITEETLGRTQSELRALTNSLFTSQEEERRIVASELHDDVTQRLAHLQIELERLQAGLPGDQGDLAGKMAGLSRRTAELSESVRQISHRLHPSIIADLGLAEAIKSLVDEFRNREQMAATFRSHNVPGGIPHQIAGVMYRITQEALRNVAKHAGKTHVKVTLEGRAGHLLLEVKDLGEGFDVNDRNHGLGLVIMAERARLVQGLFSVESSLGNGATVRVEVPFPSDESQ